ncbi:MAG: sulfurtransferase complex subunit TusB [Halomonas sp.]
MLLHILNRAPDSVACRQALAAMGPEDRLLLIEDGVIGALAAQRDAFPGLAGRLYALREDLESRGMLARRADDVRVVDVEGFVALTEECERTVSWY